MDIPKSCLKPVVSLLYATKLAFIAPNLCWACALASPVIFLTGDYVMQIGFGQISPSASSARDLGTRLTRFRLFRDPKAGQGTKCTFLCPKFNKFSFSTLFPILLSCVLCSAIR